MKKIIVAFLGTVLFAACAEEVVKKPDNLISKDDMVKILHDLALLNANKSAAASDFENSGIDIMEYLYKTYQIDSAQFAQSDLYYASIPLEYQTIYKEVERRLTVQKDTLEDRGKRKNEEMRQASVRRQDSINALKDSLKVKKETPTLEKN
ncbi:DUF4296 domain-containing protein [Flagellimonas zhangzhouensis]|uniref:DUF4296 domain-containing protein n=1 Tax=Flagellimonas zhangzhouensis TaxID=1073328 RepID=A0A1H2VFT8_9FLAO|nr:DUF4296 domain-containing protein [Allomuricauda zhangzhouensis]SDQ08145.1 protein of unknown function [Allomuricauda zhangzhouensis]SDW67171.1 protein of unknown function [Allomuricauda zhangzhouensis]